MRLHDPDTGMSVELVYDGDGFPTVTIDTAGGYYNDQMRPAVEVVVNDVVVHEMFNDTDTRWAGLT